MGVFSYEPRNKLNICIKAPCMLVIGQRYDGLSPEFIETRGSIVLFFPNWWLFSLQKNTKSEAVPIVWQNNDSECTQLQLKLFSSFPLYTPSVFSSALCSAAALRYALITDFSSIYLAVMTVIKSSSALKSNAKSSHPLALCCASCLLARRHPFLVVPHLSIDLLRCVSKPVVSCLNHGNFALMAHGHHLPTVGAYGQWA